jgi:hypothetical protein
VQTEALEPTDEIGRPPKMESVASVPAEIDRERLSPLGQRPSRSGIMLPDDQQPSRFQRRRTPAEPFVLRDRLSGLYEGTTSIPPPGERCPRTLEYNRSGIP